MGGREEGRKRGERKKEDRDVVKGCQDKEPTENAWGEGNTGAQKSGDNVGAKEGRGKRRTET